MAVTGERNDRRSALGRLRADAEAAHLAPLWEFFRDWFGPEPDVKAVPHLWRYDTLQPLLLEAARIISAEEAERRVLVLENPGLEGVRLATDSLYAGLQLIVPGEIAPLHRHTPAALRFIVEGHGAYTSVEGEQVFMAPGDFITTPSWLWHEHGNQTQEPTIWLDVLDVALLRFLGAQFSEVRPHRGATGTPPSSRAADAPHFSHPYAEARQTLEDLRRDGRIDPCHGYRREYLDRASGGPAIPTISTFLQLVPSGFASRAYRSTAGAVCSVVEGAGRVTIGAGPRARTFRYDARDLWAVPSWQPVCIEAEDESVVFSASDQTVQQKLGIWREERSKA